MQKLVVTNSVGDQDPSALCSGREDLLITHARLSVVAGSTDGMSTVAQVGTNSYRNVVIEIEIGQERSGRLEELEARIDNVPVTSVIGERSLDCVARHCVCLGNAIDVLATGIQVIGDQRPDLDPGIPQMGTIESRAKWVQFDMAVDQIIIGL